MENVAGHLKLVINTAAYILLTAVYTDMKQNCRRTEFVYGPTLNWQQGGSRTLLFLLCFAFSENLPIRNGS